MPSYWIVVCPEPQVAGGLWATWYRENCVAVGWGPPDYSLEGPTDNRGWGFARDRLKKMQVGDKVIPFLLRWRIGPVGTVTRVDVSDSEWSPTAPAGAYGDPQPSLGRRISVTWASSGMPSGGEAAIVPEALRSRGPLARHTLEELSTEQYERLVSALGDSANWVDVPVVASTGVEARELPAALVAELSLLERDLQKFLSRNLGTIEPGLKPHPDYQLEEYSTDVGRIDLLCQDARGDLVVIELKAECAGDDAVGQVLGYMAWVKENIGKDVNTRGMIICKDATARILNAAKLVPGLSIRRFRMSFSIEDTEKP